MMLRDGRREVHDLGPTPALSSRIPSGAIARPVARGGERVRPATYDPNVRRSQRRATDPEYAAKLHAYDAAYAARKRATDPEWVARRREQDRAYRARKKAAA